MLSQLRHIVEQVGEAKSLAAAMNTLVQQTVHEIRPQSNKVTYDLSLSPNSVALLVLSHDKSISLAGLSLTKMPCLDQL